jgi:hypothetical protein
LTIVRIIEITVFENDRRKLKLTFDHVERHDGGYLRHGLRQLHLEVLPPLLLSLGAFPVPGDLEVTDGVHSDRDARVGGERAENLLVSMRELGVVVGIDLDLVAGACGRG